MTEELAVTTQTFNVNDSLFFNVQKFEHAQRIGMALAKATMIPQHYRENVGNCLIALNLAERMQADPMMVMQNTYIVHGKPGIEAKLAIALINTSGRFEPLKYKYKTDQSGEVIECCAYAKEKATGEELTGPEVTWKMVEGEKWDKNDKWHTMRKLMFTYRAAMFFARVNIPEALLGFYTTEEIIDMQQAGSGTYTAPEQKATDLTEKIKEKPNYAAQDLKGKLDEGDKSVEVFEEVKVVADEEKPDYTPKVVTEDDEEGSIVPDEEKLAVAQAKLEKNRKAEQEGAEGPQAKDHMGAVKNTPTGTQADIENARKELDAHLAGGKTEEPDMIEWLRIARPSTSVKNAKEWMKTYRKFEEEVDFLADHNLTKQLQGKKAKTIQYLKDNEPPTEPPQTAGAQEQAKRKEDFIDYCFEADKKVELESPTPENGVGLIDAVLAVEDYADLNSVKEINFGTFKASIRSEAARRGITIEG